MKAAIVSIGDEVLYGKIINSNAAYLSKQLSIIGIEVVVHITTGDSYESIYKVYQELLKTDIAVIISTGGLGPTHDDFTKKVIADVCGLEMVFYQEAFDHYDAIFKKSNTITYDSNLSQAYFPKGSSLVPNNRGTAFGGFLNYLEKDLIMLVGPPFELIDMVEHTILPFLQTKSLNHTILEEYYVMGGGESQFEDKLKPVFEAYPMVTINPYASRGIIRYVIKANESYTSEFQLAKNAFFELLGDHVVGLANKEVEEYVFDELYEKRMKISVAESCTAGMFISKLVNVSGSSMIFDEAFITYSNQSKITTLGIAKSLIAEYGAVSAEVAEAMALGAKTKAKSNIGVGITGIAGPTGGTPLKPVGLVYFSFVIEDYVYIERKQFQGSREDIRTKATMYIMWRLLVELRKRK